MSALPTDVSQVREQVPDLANQIGPPAGLSPRQARLARLWSYYRCANYDGRSVGWDGLPAGTTEHDLLGTAAFTPQGFYDAGGTAPLSTRRPSAPFYLVRVVVNRFTGLLFSAKRHPKISVPGDKATEDWLNAFARTTRLWSRAILARAYGGAMGSVCMSFKFVGGKPVVEVHDPRWCEPEFSDRGNLVLKRIVKMYQYRDTTRDPATGDLVEGWFWYRRILDEEVDEVWPRVPVLDGEPPRWDAEKSSRVEHNLGFCPAVWIQNIESQEDIDGDPDCHGVYELNERIDGLYSQANKGTLANCDPTLVINSDAEMGGVRTGSDNTLKLEKGASANYLEMNGGGARMAVELAEKLEARALIMARCVLEGNASGPARTEFEIQQNYSNMLEQADLLREQYGELGVLRLLLMALRAARKLASPVRSVGPSGATITRSVVKLVHKGVQLSPGPSDEVELVWPSYYEVSDDRIAKAVDAASKAKMATLVDAEHATRHVAAYFGIEHPKDVATKADEEKAEVMASLGAAGAPGKPGGGFG